jgi:hypothetical protein
MAKDKTRDKTREKSVARPLGPDVVDDKGQRVTRLGAARQRRR